MAVTQAFQQLGYSRMVPRIFSITLTWSPRYNLSSRTLGSLSFPVRHSARSTIAKDAVSAITSRRKRRRGHVPACVSAMASLSIQTGVMYMISCQNLTKVISQSYIAIKFVYSTVEFTKLRWMAIRTTSSWTFLTRMDFYTPSQDWEVMPNACIKVSWMVARREWNLSKHRLPPSKPSTLRGRT